MKPVALVIASLATAAAALLAACSSPPVIRLHSLSATQAALQGREAAAASLPVDLGVVGVPASVDQPQWLVRLPDDSLRLLEQEQWAAPLRDELRTALWERLRSNFGAVDPRHAPSVAAWRVQVDVQRFESIAGREAWVEASWSIASTAKGNNGALACQSSLHESAAGDVAALAAAHRRAASRLADEIGQGLQTLARGQTASCAPRQTP